MGNRDKGIYLYLLFLLIFSSCGDQQASPNQDSTVEGQEYREGEVLVKFKSGINSIKIQSMHRAIGSIVKEGFRFINVERVRLPHGLSVRDAIKKYKDDPDVEYAEPNYIVRKAETLKPLKQVQGQGDIFNAAVVPNDTYFHLQWGLNNTGQIIEGVTGTSDADIDAPEAWDIHTGNGGSTSSPVIVAVIDTGVDYNHPDLSANIWTNNKENIGDANGDGCPGICGVDDDGDGKIDEDSNNLQPGECKTIGGRLICYSNDLKDDDDENGYVDDIRGWNFAYNNNNPMDDDVDGHGTHVAGIIGAVGNNNTGVSGVNWNVKIMPLKLMDSTGSGTIADVIEAIDYSIKMGAKVINASYTYPQSCISTAPFLAERDAIKTAGDVGLLFVAAAGNYGCNNDNTPFYPASHPLDNIISVAASDSNDKLTSWSNYGLTSVHVAAPGDEIYSTIRSDLCGEWDYAADKCKIWGYGYMTGTSMASPFVSGLAGLIASYKQTYTHKEIKNAILASVDSNTSMNNKLITGGRINTFNALLSNPQLSIRPSGLSLQAVSGSSVTLIWQDNSSNEDGFRIERKTGDAGIYEEIGSVNTDTVTYVDSTVREGTKYYYRVRAYKGDYYSNYSNEIAVTTPLNAPTNLTAHAVSGSQINLSWTDNSSVEDGFEIERKAGFDGIYSQIATAGADVTAYSDTDLSAGTTYYYRVRAYNTAGDSSYSNEASAITQSPSSGGGGGCFIATAAYGSYLAPEVRILRQFRDKHLITNPIGRAFVEFYYNISPPAAEYISRHEDLRALTRLALTPVVYGVKHIGISIIVIISFLTVIALILIRRLGASE